MVLGPMTRLPPNPVEVRNLIGHNCADCGFWNGLCDDGSETDALEAK